MKQVLFLSASAFLFLTACNSSDQATVKGMKAENNTTESSAADAKAQRNKQTVMSMFDAMNKHDLNAATASWAPDCKDYGDGSSSPVSADSSKAMMQTWFTAFPDFTSENRKAVAEGDMVMLWSEQSGTWKGDLMGQKATGKAFKAPDADIFRLNDEGKIIEHHNVQSFATIAGQIGFKMK